MSLFKPVGSASASWVLQYSETSLHSRSVLGIGDFCKRIPAFWHCRNLNNVPLAFHYEDLMGSNLFPDPALAIAAPMAHLLNLASHKLLWPTWAFHSVKSCSSVASAASCNTRVIARKSASVKSSAYLVLSSDASNPCAMYPALASSLLLNHVSEEVIFTSNN